MQKCFRGWIHTCKIKHYTSNAWPREVDGSKTFLQMFYFTCNHGLKKKADSRHRRQEMVMNQYCSRMSKNCTLCRLLQRMSHGIPSSAAQSPIITFYLNFSALAKDISVSAIISWHHPLTALPWTS